MNPLTRQRWRRFRALKRAWFALWILAGLYVLSLGAGLLCNSRPLWMRFEGRSYFPFCRAYADDLLTGSGLLTRPDYRRIAGSARFRADPANRVLWAPWRYGPLDSVPFESIALPEQVDIVLDPEPKVGALTVSLSADAGWVIAEAEDCAWFLGAPEAGLPGRPLRDFAVLPAPFWQAARERLANRPAPPLAVEVVTTAGRAARVHLATFRPRRAAPAAVRMLWREPPGAAPVGETVTVDRALAVAQPGPLWSALAPGERAPLLALAGARFEAPAAATNRLLAGRPVSVRFEREEVRYPLRPVRGHPLGIDSAGRDVLARILYGLRISLSFGFLLVTVTMAVGMLVGAIQGYYGGAVDIVGQRLIEIWDALPFLYILILMGSVFGSSFGLLLLCYGLFNWVGISYYQRAEFLRLRHAPFVESARCLGIPPLAIMARHILPNALTPVITFFPFSLVGAIGLLAALDYLGFGLPPPNPSWGELLTQAQEYSWAWWLTLYPALALFTVMLLGVLVGEGVRNAFDPRPAARLE